MNTGEIVMANIDILLQNIKSLYTRIFLFSLHNRITDYHHSKTAPPHSDIGSAFQSLIHDIVSDISVNNADHNFDSLKFLYQSEQLTHHTDTKSIPTTTSMTINGLALYFKKNKVLEKNPSMAARLRRCTWDHLHSANRLARSGDEKMAKMHANIACDAMNTLSHYMPEEEYIEFFNLIYSQLSYLPDEAR
jgi:hypothetical protein